MILNNEKTKCETNMSGGTAFSICANAAMFRILSSGLYSNKEKAIIREVSCNAYDANVDAGNGDVPIVVHLPNALEPYFSIKDSGPGLNPEQMVSIYTQYGNSTKTDRNDQIGALGLGSKSPFSYIDSFTVISITEGLKATYSCYIDGNGEPQLQPFGQEDTDEPNGVEVTFPVKQEDYTTFREESEITFRPFLVRPSVQGNSEYKVKEFKVLLTSDESLESDWQLVESVSSYSYNRDKIRVAVQGNIEYPINTNKIEEHLSGNAKKLLNESFRLHFNIGELDIAASREELGYDKITIDNIVAKFEKMAKEITDKQNEKIDKFETLYEARQYISNLRYQSSLYRDFNFTYKGDDLSNEVKIENNLSMIRYYRNNRGHIARTDLAKGNYSSSFTYAVPKDPKEIIYIVNDNNKKAQGVTKARSLVNHNVEVILLQSQEIIKTLGYPEFVNASDIETVSKAKTQSSGNFFKKFYKSRTESYQWSGNYASSLDLDLDLEEEFYFIEIKGQKAKKDIYNMYAVGVKLGIIDENTSIIGVQSAHANTKKFKSYNSVNFVDFIREEIKNSKELSTHISKFEDLSIYSILNNISSSFTSLMKKESFCESLGEDHLFSEMRKDFLRVNKVAEEKLEDLRVVVKELGIDIPPCNYVKHKTLRKCYPLIEELGWRPNPEKVLDYVKGIDLLRLQQQLTKVANETDETEDKQIKKEEEA